MGNIHWLLTSQSVRNKYRVLVSQEEEKEDRKLINEGKKETQLF